MAAIIRVTPPLMKSRFRVLALRLAPLNYMMRSPLDFALTREGVGPFFLVAALCALLWWDFRLATASRPSRALRVSLLLYSIGQTATGFSAQFDLP